jgi:hypothetical protein
MYKFVTIYFTPKDPERFKKYYAAVHVALGEHPLALRRFHTYDIGNVTDHAVPTDVNLSNVFLYFEAEFASKESFYEYCVSWKRRPRILRTMLTAD